MEEVTNRQGKAIGKGEVAIDSRLFLKGYHRRKPMVSGGASALNQTVIGQQNP